MPGRKPERRQTRRDSGGASSEGSTTDKKRFSLAALSPPDQQHLLDLFAKELMSFLSTSEESPTLVEGEGQSKKDLMSRIGAGLYGQDLDVRQFDTLLKALFAQGYLRINFRRLPDLERRVRERLSSTAPREVVVVSGSDQEQFSRAAGEEFIRELFRVADVKRQAAGSENVEINVGVVSGRTIGALVKSIKDLDWVRELGKNPAELPKIRFIALNSSLTVGEHLKGNANILVFQMAEMIERQLRRQTRSGASTTTKTETFGLAAPLFVELSELPEVDKQPQIGEVLYYTEPYRRMDEKERQEKIGTQDDTRLDIVLTGVGELPLSPRTRGRSSSDGGDPDNGSESTRLNSDHGGESRGSIFVHLARQFDVDVDRLIEEDRIVGDLAFTPIRADGQVVPLRRTTPRSAERHDQDDPGVACTFYTAVRVPVLERMAKDHSKSVILVARSTRLQYKVPAIFASVAGKHHQYVSNLILDEPTARELLEY